MEVWNNSWSLGLEPALQFCYINNGKTKSQGPLRFKGGKTDIASSWEEMLSHMAKGMDTGRGHKLKKNLQSICHSEEGKTHFLVFYCGKQN